MLLELIERLLTIFVAAAQKVIPVLKIEVHPQHNFSGTITWLAGLDVRDWGKLEIHIAVGLAI